MWDRRLASEFKITLCAYNFSYIIPFDPGDTSLESPHWELFKTGLKSDIRWFGAPPYILENFRRHSVSSALVKLLVTKSKCAPWNNGSYWFGVKFGDPLLSCKITTKYKIMHQIYVKCLSSRVMWRRNMIGPCKVRVSCIHASNTVLDTCHAKNTRNWDFHSQPDKSSM